MGMRTKLTGDTVTATMRKRSERRSGFKNRLTKTPTEEKREEQEEPPEDSQKGWAH